MKTDVDEVLSWSVEKIDEWCCWFELRREDEDLYRQHGDDAERVREVMEQADADLAAQQHGAPE